MVKRKLACSVSTVTWARNQSKYRRFGEDHKDYLAEISGKYVFDKVESVRIVS